MKPQSVAQALAAGVTTLRDAGVDDPAGDARHLMAQALGVERMRLTLHLPDSLDKETCTHFQSLVSRRAARAPLSHIRGHRAFYGRTFRISDQVLDPRPDTETLIGLALMDPFQRVLDLGTGSGAILLTLLAERPRATGLGVDISGTALDVARANAVTLGVADRCELILSDWCEGVSGTFDLLVSNPPYIAADEMAGLDPEVRDHEPLIALSDGADGLTAYRMIAMQAGPHLAPDGRLLVEIGARQGDAVTAILAAAGFADIAVHRDLNHKDRVVSGRFSA